MTTATPSIDKKSLEGRKFRFVVSSAEDAARIIRERLGETAQVLSVKQVNGKGLTRFLSSPQLEIIVTVPKSDDVSEDSEVDDVYRGPEDVSEFVGVDVPEAEEPVTYKPEPSVSVAESTQDIDQVLGNSGFDGLLLEGMKRSADWSSIQSMPLAHGLVEVTEWFKREYMKVPEREISQRVAFFGAPGVGTTSALCKRLAKDVFICKKDPQVIKLESENPNTDDALRAFCDVMGISLFKDEGEQTQLNDEEPLYVDVSGCHMSDQGQWQQIRDRIDCLEIETRVLVINAAYDSALIKESYKLAEKMSATHVVFTHMDEVLTLSKLWPFILFGGLPTLFLSCGQDITGDIEDQVMDYMMHKTFPSIILN